MARAGNGAAEFIYPGERIEPKVLRQLAKALAPALTDVRVDWGGARVTPAPSHLPPLFAGSRFLVYGFLAEGLPATVTLHARSARGPVAFPLALAACPVTSGSLLATLAARTLIRELEDQASETAGRRGSRQRRERPDRLTDEIIRLGTTYQLCSAHTSFVAIERRETPTEGDLQFRKVPVLLTHGWGGEPVQMLRRLAAVPPPGAMPMDAILERRRAIMSPPAYLADALTYSADWEVPKGAAQAAPRPLDRLILLQAADGSWDLTEDLADIVGCALSTLEVAFYGATGDGATIRRAWATALALAFLELRAANTEDEWALLVGKARNWLGQCGAVSPTGEPWIALAKLILEQG